MESWEFVLKLTVLLVAAMALGALFEALRQSAILGYLLAGLALGPGGLHLLSDSEAVATLAELGVALLLFTIGLEFSVQRLRGFGRSVLFAGALQVLLTLALASAVAAALGLGAKAALAVGAVIAPSSTAVVTRLLIDRAELESVHGRTAFAILLLQDVALVPLVLVISLLGSEGTAMQAAIRGGQTIAGVTLLMIALLAVNRHLLPRVLSSTALQRNRELPLLLATATCLGAAWAAHAFELSPALGAFVAGVFLAESPFAVQIRADVGPLRTLFVTLFFASIGMIANAGWLLGHAGLVLAIVALMVTGKALIVWAVLLWFRRSHRHAVATALCLAQVGEFSFVLVALGRANGIISEGLHQLLVGSTVVTIALTPLLVAYAAAAGQRVQSLLRRGSGLETHRPKAEREQLSDHVILVGFGPAGRMIQYSLDQIEMPSIIAELNAQTVETARRLGFRAEVGDASRPEVLDHLNITQARAIVIAIPDHHAALQIIVQVRSIAPGVGIIARARYHTHALLYIANGADVVVDEELQVGTLLGTEVLRMLRREQPNEEDVAVRRGD